MSVVIIANSCYSFTSDLPQTGCICTFFIVVLLCALNSSPLLNLTVLAVSQDGTYHTAEAAQSPVTSSCDNSWNPNQLRVPEHILLNNPFRAGTGLSSVSDGCQDILVACLMTCIAWKQQYILCTDIAFMLLEHLIKQNKCEKCKKIWINMCNVPVWQMASKLAYGYSNTAHGYSIQKVTWIQ
jgi:hypothetical protein